MDTRDNRFAELVSFIREQIRSVGRANSDYGAGYLDALHEVFEEAVRINDEYEPE